MYFNNNPDFELYPKLYTIIPTNISILFTERDCFNIICVLYFFRI